MNDRFIDYTNRQSWINALSITFARLFATTLATSVSTTFTQVLRWYLRRPSFSISKTDALFSLAPSSSNLHRLGFLRSIPVVYFFGLLIPLILIVTIFPPDSLVVDQLLHTYDYADVACTLDIDNRENGSASDFFAFGMFEVGFDCEYLKPYWYCPKPVYRIYIDGGVLDSATRSAPQPPQHDSRGIGMWCLCDCATRTFMTLHPRRGGRRKTLWKRLLGGSIARRT